MHMCLCRAEYGMAEYASTSLAVTFTLFKCTICNTWQSACAAESTASRKGPVQSSHSAASSHLIMQPRVWHQDTAPGRTLSEGHALVVGLHSSLIK